MESARRVVETLTPSVLSWWKTKSKDAVALVKIDFETDRLKQDPPKVVVYEIITRGIQIRGVHGRFVPTRAANWFGVCTTVISSPRSGRSPAHVREATAVQWAKCSWRVIKYKKARKTTRVRR